MVSIDSVESGEQESYNEDAALIPPSFPNLTTAEKLRFVVSSYARRFEHTARFARLSTALSYLTRAIRCIAIFLLPSFLHKSTGQTQPLATKKRNSVAAIDGLRGIACFIVFNGHFARELGGSLFWSGDWIGKNLFVQWPFVHLFWSGRSMVYIFWVVGGYTLSIKPLKQLYTGEYAAFQKTWSSSLVRRGFRLYLPPLIGVYIIGILTWLGIFEAAYPVRHNPAGGNTLGLMEDFPVRHDHLTGQIKDAFQESSKMFKIWTWDGYIKPGAYNDAYWTIPVQYRTALFMFLILLAGSRMKANYRTLLISIMTASGLFLWQRDEITTFFGGMLLADIDIRRSASKATLPLQQMNTEKPTPSRSWLGAVTSKFSKLGSSSKFYLAMFIFGWLLCSTAAVGWNRQPIVTAVVRRLSFLLRGNGDDSSAVRSVGAIFLTYGIIHCTYIHPIFTSRVATYLGKISFSLYLTHGVVLRSCLYPLLPYIYFITRSPGPISHGNTTAVQFAGSYMLGFIVMLPLVLWIADVFWRLVEIRTGHWTLWIDNLVSPKDG